MTTRTQYRLRITDPNDDTSFVDVPVIYQIAFIDPREYGQEYFWSILNVSNNQSRAVHTHRVLSASADVDGNVAVDQNNYLDVERIENFKMLDPRDWAQDKWFGLGNWDPAPIPPDQVGTQPDVRHQTTHVVRYTADNTPDGEPWIDVELVDQITFRDRREWGQEYLYSLHNDPGTDNITNKADDPYQPKFAECDQSLPLVEAKTNDTINPPWRMSPFQNVVNVNFSNYGAVKFDDNSFMEQEGYVDFVIPPFDSFVLSFWALYSSFANEHTDRYLLIGNQGLEFWASRQYTTIGNAPLSIARVFGLSDNEIIVNSDGRFFAFLGVEIVPVGLTLPLDKWSHFLLSISTKPSEPISCSSDPMFGAQCVTFRATLAVNGKNCPVTYVVLPFDSVSNTCNGWKITLESLVINPAIFRTCFAEFQFWAGKYLDVSNPSNIAKFITKSGTPVSSKVPAKTLGKQTILLRETQKSPPDFNKNKGDVSVPDFVVSGTMTDFVPKPKLGVGKVL